MRTAYALLGIVWLLAIAAFAYGYFRPASSPRDAARGITNTATTTTPMTNAPFSITSAEFSDGSSIPSRFTCDATNPPSPPISISGTPAGARSLALIMDDPDIPQQFKQQLGKNEYDHWVLFNIPSETTEIASGAGAGVQGKNTSGKLGYTPPCPPPQYEPSTHRYIFTLYALDAMLPLREGATKEEVLSAMEGHIIERTGLVGMYKRK